MGFDKGFGLKSEYVSFYPYFIKNASEENIIKKEIEKDKKANYLNWSDLEVALGEFTRSVSDENVFKFVEDKVELDTLLKEYLLKEEEKFVCDDIQIKSVVKNGVKQIRSGNCVEERMTIEKTLNTYLSEDYFYECITFNYTKCVDKIWQGASKEIVGSHTYAGSTKSERFGTVLHVHGTLEDNEMLIGVNDKTQMVRDKFLNNTNLDDNDKKHVKNRIIVYDNQNIFSIQ